MLWSFLYALELSQVPKAEKLARPEFPELQQYHQICPAGKRHPRFGFPFQQAKCLIQVRRGSQFITRKISSHGIQ
jgi:hypothetical protein